MLNWLGGGPKVDHPMADAKEARQIVAGLPAADPTKALQEITEWLDSIHRTEAFRADRRFENIDLLDSAAKNHQRKLSADYLNTPRQQKFQEHQLWTTVSGFWSALGDGYILCIDQCESGTSGAAAARKNLPVIVARALRVLTLQLKWLLLRYGPISPKLWLQLARLYQIAESKGFADATVVVYPGVHGESTIRHELLKSLMLAASSTDGLPPLRQQIAERVVAQFADSFLLARKPEGCTYSFDLALPKPPLRMLKGVAATPTMLYFGAGEGLRRLRDLIRQITETDAIPPDINLGATYGKDLVLPTLKHLELYWAETLPARHSERRQATARITVVPGLNELLGVLDPSRGDELDFSEIHESAESWVVENVSDGGYGAIIPPVKSDWIKVGALIGLQVEGKSYWGVGTIRRISRDEHQQRRVGIQLMSKVAIPVKLARQRTASSPGGASRESGAAVLLSTAPDSQGEVGVVMREGVFNARESMEMTVRDKSYLLMPSRLMEGGEDFDWAKFKVLQRAE